MIRVHFNGRAVWLLVLGLTLTQASRSESQAPGQPAPPRALAMASDTAYLFHSLSDLGDDPDLHAFAMQVLMHEGVAVTYYAPKQLLFVPGDAARQARVAAFLKDLRQAIVTAPRADRQPARQSGQVVQAGVAALVPARTSEPVPLDVPSYATPRPQQPKHLLHFIMGIGVRYEGEGLIDANVVECAKAFSQAQGQSSSAALSPAQAVTALAGPLSALAGQTYVTSLSGANQPPLSGSSPPLSTSAQFSTSAAPGLNAPSVVSLELPPAPPLSPPATATEPVNARQAAPSTLTMPPARD